MAQFCEKNCPGEEFTGPKLFWSEAFPAYTSCKLCKLLKPVQTSIRLAELLKDIEVNFSERVEVSARIQHCEGKYDFNGITSGWRAGQPETTALKLGPRRECRWTWRSSCGLRWRETPATRGSPALASTFPPLPSLLLPVHIWWRVIQFHTFDCWWLNVDGDDFRNLYQSQDCTLVRVTALPPSNRCQYWNNPTAAIPCQKLNFWRGADSRMCHKSLPPWCPSIPQ